MKDAALNATHLLWGSYWKHLSSRTTEISRVLLRPSHRGRPICYFYQSQVLHTKVYRGLRGVTSSSGRGACWQFTTLSLCPRDSPGKNTGVGCHFLLQGIFPTQESNLGLCIADRFHKSKLILLAVLILLEVLILLWWVKNLDFGF